MVTKEVELVIPGEMKEEPIFYTIIKKFDVVPNIVEASFSTEMGWAIVRFEGTQQQIESLFEYFRIKNIRVSSR